MKMADSGDLEKKGAAADGALADDRSTTEGQVYASEGLHAGLNGERKYGGSEFSIHLGFRNPVSSRAHCLP